MNLLDKINKLQDEVIKKSEKINVEELDILDSVILAGFEDKRNTYYTVLNEANLPREERDVMFKYIEDYIPSLEYYLKLLEEEMKFYTEVHKKQSNNVSTI